MTLKIKYNLCAVDFKLNRIYNLSVKNFDKGEPDGTV